MSFKKQKRPSLNQYFDFIDRINFFLLIDFYQNDLSTNLILTIDLKGKIEKRVSFLIKIRFPGEFLLIKKQKRPFFGPIFWFFRQNFL